MNKLLGWARPGRVLIAVPVLSGLLLFAAVPYSHADDRGRCQEQVEKAEAKLHEAIREHGELSRQANQRRRNLNAERERCWNEHHAWWNAREHQWHDQRDWDGDHDFDRDRR